MSLSNNKLLKILCLTFMHLYIYIYIYYMCITVHSDTSSIFTTPEEASTSTPSSTNDSKRNLDSQKIHQTYSTAAESRFASGNSDQSPFLSPSVENEGISSPNNEEAEACQEEWKSLDSLNDKQYSDLTSQMVFIRAILSLLGMYHKLITFYCIELYLCLAFIAKCMSQLVTKPVQETGQNSPSQIVMNPLPLVSNIHL